MFRGLQWAVLPLSAAVGAFGLVASPVTAGAATSASSAAMRQRARMPPPTGTPRGDRFNVGATHSPQVLRQTAGRAGGPGVPSRRLAGALQGVDVAAYQHPDGAGIDWRKVAAANIQFTAIKATEGAYYRNPYALSDLAHAQAAGLSVMAYAFAVPNGNGASSSPVRQADYLINYLRKGSAGIPPVMLDIEYNPYGGECYGLSKPAMVRWIWRFDAAVQVKTGAYPIIYTPRAWWKTCTGGIADFSRLPLWVPSAASASSPPLPLGWDGWAFWQYSGTGTVNGIAAAGNTDLDQLDPGSVPLLDPGIQHEIVGGQVSLQVKQADPVAGRIPSFTAAGLPPGVSISVSGTITGRPVSAGTYRATVSASDGQGDSGAVSFTWSVVP